MQEINKERFIADTAARIFAEMFSRQDSPPDPRLAVQMAQKLWEEMVSQRGLFE
jgi:hypothetical protein